MNSTRSELPNRYRIDDIEVDQAGLRVETPTGAVTLEPKVMQVLTELAAHAGDVVTRQHLIETIWQVSFGGDESLTRAVSLLRKTFGETHGKRSLIETVPRRGYRLVADVGASGNAAPKRQTLVPDDNVDVRPAETSRPGGGRHPILIAVVLAGVLAALGLGALYKNRTPTDSSVTVWPALASFEMSEADRSAIEADAPGFDGALAVYNDRLRVFIPDSELSLYHVHLSPRSDDGEGVYQFELLRGEDDDRVFQRDLPLAGRSGDAFAERVVVLSSHLMKCGESLLNGLSISPMEDGLLVPMLFELCDKAARFSVQEPLEMLSEQLSTTFPDKHGLKAVHAIILMSQPTQHRFGQRDALMEGKVASAKALLDAARRQPELQTVVELGDRLVRAQEAGLAEQEEILSDVSARNWLELQAIKLRATLLKRTGRLGEAEYVLSAASNLWPNDEELRGSLATTLIAEGKFSEANDSLSSALRLFGDSMVLTSTAEVTAIMYGEDEEAARAGVARAPDFYRPCMAAFRAAKFDDGPPVKDQCDSLDPVMRSRMFALLGDYDRSFALIERFDPAAAGIGVALHYSEFLELWKQDRMWDVAARFGMVDYWKQTNTRPDMCFGEGHSEICNAKL